MVAVAWQELKELVCRPSEVFEDLLARHGLAVSSTFGMLSYYMSTLQIGELLLPPDLGGLGYAWLNFPLALGRMALIVSLLHLASRLVSRRSGRWVDLFSIWGYTQLPHIGLTLLAVAFAMLPRATGINVTMLWMVVIGAMALLLSLWGLILKLHALRTCYQLDGGRLLGVIAIALVFYVALLWLERTFVYERSLVPQTALEAMEPAASPGGVMRRNLALPLDTFTYRLRHPERGEVVGFVPPGREVAMPLAPGFRLRSIGRIVGLPGETAELRDGRLLIDHLAVNEPYQKGSQAASLSTTIIPAGHVLILGDNRALAVEAYGGGIVPVRAIRGRLTDVGRLKWWLALGTWLW